MDGSERARRALPPGVIAGRLAPRPRTAPAALVESAAESTASEAPERGRPEQGWRSAERSLPASVAPGELTERSLSYLGSKLNVAQREIVRAVLEGRDLLCVAPAGEGSRLAHQLAARRLSGPMLVVGARPLELRAQHDALLMRRVPAVRIDPSVRGAARQEALARLAQGGPLVVHATPDVLGEPEVLSLLGRVGLSRITVEDAHCFAAAGHELRVAYASLPRLVTMLGAPPLTLDTGAASAAVRSELARGFRLREPVMVVRAPVRTSLTLDTVRAEGATKHQVLLGLLARLRRPGLVLCATEHEVSGLYAELRAARIPVHRFHAGMSAGERGAELLNFSLPGRRTVMIATSALGPAAGGLLGLGDVREADLAPTSLGVGFEKRDLRFVIHWNLPASLEQYAREVDLAGRDGEPARCVLISDPSDRAVLAAQLASGRPQPDPLAELAEHLGASHAEGLLPSRGAPATSLAALARVARVSERSAGLFAAMLEDAGLVERTPEGVRPTVRRRALAAGARRLALQLGELREADVRRLAAVSAFADTTTCKAALLADHFGLEPVSAACECSICTGNAELLAPIAPPAQPMSRRREPATELRVDRPREGAPAGAADAAPPAGANSTSALPV